MRDQNDDKSRKFAPVGILVLVLGLLLFAFFIRKAGVSEIIAGIRRLGFAFIIILGISATRHGARSLAWIKCFEPPYRLRLRDAFAGRLMGDAIGNLVPLASIAVSEPSKAVFVRDRVPLMAGLCAITLENIFYSLSVVLFIFSGTTVLLLSFSMPRSLRYASIVTLVTTAAIAPLGYLIIHKQWRFLSSAISYFGNRGVRRTWVQKGVPRAQILEDRIYGFYGRNRGRVAPILALEVWFHLAGIAEIYTTLLFISQARAPTLLTAFVLESVNRVINVAFKFVPLRTGIDEAGTGMLAKVLGFTTAIGVTLAIVRKARDIFWAAIGLALMVQKGFSARAVTHESDEVIDEMAAPGVGHQLDAKGVRSKANIP